MAVFDFLLNCNRVVHPCETTVKAFALFEARVETVRKGIETSPRAHKSPLAPYEGPGRFNLPGDIVVYYDSLDQNSGLPLNLLVRNTFGIKLYGAVILYRCLEGMVYALDLDRELDDIKRRLQWQVPPENVELSMIAV